MSEKVFLCPCYLLGLQVTDDGVDVAQDFVYEGHHLAHLHLHKVAPALLCDLDECVARHVLHTVVGLCGPKEQKTLKYFVPKGHALCRQPHLKNRFSH